MSINVCSSCLGLYGPVDNDCLPCMPLLVKNKQGEDKHTENVHGIKNKSEDFNKNFTQLYYITKQIYKT